MRLASMALALLPHPQGTNTLATVKKLPGVLAFQRSFIVTDAAMYNDIDGTETPLLVLQHGIRATQNVAASSDAAKGEGERDVAQIQITQTARLDDQASAMIVRFGLRMTDIRQALHSCTGANDSIVRDSIESFIDRAIDSKCPDEIAGRIARNIANGRWLWRNRLMAGSIKITVMADDREVASFDGLAVPLNTFSDQTSEEKKVADLLADGLRGNRASGIQVIARVEFGVSGSVEVFPSQNYVEIKPTGFARPLYKLTGSVKPEKSTSDGFDVVGQAALRDQKISNALKTIDTWYPGFEDEGRVIPIEPNGANIETAKFYRPGTGKSSAFSILCRLDDINPESPEGFYALSVMLRGGVMGESDKKGKQAA